jgi:hypothetical protein
MQFPALSRLADRLIKLSIVVCVAVLPFCFYSYGARPEKYLINPFSASLYYLLAAVIAVLLVSLKLRASYRISIAIMLVLLGVAAYAAEVVLSLSNSAFDPRRTAAVQGGIDFDERDKLAVIADLEKRHGRVVPNVNPSNLLRMTKDGTRRSAIMLDGVETLPLAGIASVVTVYCNESGRYVVYTSDEHGFNNPTGVWTGGPLTVAAVGDSFTQGSCVSADQNTLGIIRARYPATLNLGMVNEGPLSELATLKEYLSPFQPRIILWFYYEGNDLEDLHAEQDVPLLRSYLTGQFQQGLVSKQAAIDSALSGYVQGARQRLVPANLSRMQRLRNRVPRIVKLEHIRERLALSTPGSHKEHPDVEADLPLFARILADAKNDVESWGGTLYVVYLPEWLRYAHPQAASAQREAVLSIIRSHGIPLVDMHPVFEAHGDPLSLFPYRSNGHYNEDGYRLVGETVLAAIREDAERSRDAQPAPRE